MVLPRDPTQRERRSQANEKAVAVRRSGGYDTPSILPRCFAQIPAPGKDGMPIVSASIVRRPACRELLRLLLAASLALAAGACGSHEDSVLARLIPPAPLASLDPRGDLTLRPAWGMRLDGPAAVSAWSFYVPSSPAALSARGGGIDLGPLHESSYLVWTGSLRAGEVDVLRFRFGEPLPGLVELYWNGPGDDFGPQRYLLQPPDALDARQVAFDLSSSRHWRGEVARIGLRLLDPPAAGQTLQQAEGLRYVAGEGLGNGETRYVTLEGRSMPAWLERPGTTLRRRVEVPRGARLRFHAAPWLLPGSDGVRLRVLADTRQGRRTLVERDLLPRPTPPRWRWVEIEADLAELGGETVDLLFETGPAPPGSLVVLGNPQLVGAGSDTRPNVVLISLDTVRADHLSVYGYGRPTTPHLADWARRRATVFETAVAAAPWTLPSHASMLSGIDAVHHGVNRRGPVPSSLPLLPRLFRDAGYSTYATTAGVLLTPELGFAHGFDEFRVRGKMESLPEWDAELRNGIGDALRWLQSRQGERFFLFFHTFEAHSPYQPREPWFTRFGGSREALNAGSPVWMEIAGFESEVRPRYLLFHPPTYAGGVTYPKRVLQAQDREVAAALYDSGLAHIDRELSRLLEYLESEGLLENTIVVVTSDHGEALYEHGLVGHSSLYDHDLLVPLVIAAPLDEARGRRVGTQVRSVDIAPTLLDLAGLAPPGPLDGSSLAPLLRGEEAAPRDAWSYALSTTRGVSLRNGARGLKLIAQDTIFEPFRGGLEAYDLRRDPEESRNLDLGAARERTWQRLAREVRAGGQALHVRIANAGPGELLGEIGGKTIDGMVTSTDLGFPCCEITRTGIHFRAPAGADFTLTLHERPAGILRLKLTHAGETWEERFPAEGIPPGRRVIWVDGRWQPVAGEASPQAWTGTGLAIHREGRAESAPADEEEIRSKLRALGYLK